MSYFRKDWVIIECLFTDSRGTDNWRWIYMSCWWNNICKEGFLKGLYRKTSFEGWRVSSFHCLGTSGIFGTDFTVQTGVHNSIFCSYHCWSSVRKII